MTEATPSVVMRQVDMASPEALARLRKRYTRERRFRVIGLSAIALATLFLVMLIGNIFIKALPAFSHSSIVLDIALDAGQLDASGTRSLDSLRSADYAAPIRAALIGRFDDVKERARRKALLGLISSSGETQLRAQILSQPALLGQTIRFAIPLAAGADLYARGLISKEQRYDIRTPDMRVENDQILLTFDTRQLDVLTAALSLQGNGVLTLGAQDPSVLMLMGQGVYKLTHIAGGQVQARVLVPARAETKPEKAQLIVVAVPEDQRKITDQEIGWLKALEGEGRIEKRWNVGFFTSGDSREPENAGLLGALVGSLWMMLVTFFTALPLGVAAAVYLQEFAPKNRFTDLIEININNLGAVPSIIFGLLGLSIFLNVFELPRSAPLVGGLVLALLILPTIIISARVALGSVPPSIREAALGVGATKQQAVFHHVLPLALPGIMTGAIIGMARALGETAPLLMIGMVAFIVDVPKTITDAATALPVQIYLWSDLPEQMFQYKTAAAIVVLLAFLLLMNSVAVYLRRKFERRW